MPYATKILLDSISPAGRRLTTWELTYPRFVHAELMTHRLFSRNSASSRAIPNERLRARVKEDPALPLWWGKNQAGMQAREELVDAGHPPDGPIAFIKAFPRTAAENEWLRARDIMLECSQRLAEIGLHKQLCNRLIEPWMFITVIVSATSFDNWFHLRNHKDAQPEIAWVAKDMWEKFQVSTPRTLAIGEWHLPLVEYGDWTAALPPHWVGNSPDQVSREEYAREWPKAVSMLKKVSTGRVARVSLLTHDGKRDLKEDVGLHDRLLSGVATGDPLHMSPFEHIATPLENPNESSGNFRGWKQYRKEIPSEHFGEVMP